MRLLLFCENVHKHYTKIVSLIDKLYIMYYNMINQF